MGAYINPKNEEKEDFLKREGKRVDDDVKFEDIPEGSFLVVLVDNILFTAAGIAFNKMEFGAFTYEDDRYKEYFIVEKSKLLEVSDLEDYLKE